VVLHAVLAIDGSMKELLVVSGDPILAMAALRAICQWRYQQTLLNGEPVKVDTTISVIFRLH
jgi:hypothetical protein